MLLTTFLCVIATGVYGQGLDPEISQNLLSLIAEERNLRLRLETEADKLEKEIDALTVARQNATCGCPSIYTTPIAFTATLGHNINTLGSEQPIIFDEVTLNIGNAYDVRHGVFTAPFAGVFEFTTAVLNRPGYQTELELVKNGVAMTKVVSGDNGYYTMGTNAVALALIKGDEVWVRHPAASDSNLINGESTTSFTGYLVDV